MAEQAQGSAEERGLGFEMDKIELPKDEGPHSTEGGFIKFLLRGNVVDLAVAVIIGAAFVAVVTAFVKDIMTPLIAAVGGKPDFAELTFTINHSRFMYGDFINAIVAFVIVAAVLYYLVIVPMNALLSRTRRPAAAPIATTRECPECLNVVPLRARRCGYCTSPLEPVASASDQAIARH